MSKHNELGRNGEVLACQILLNKGHTILEKNFRYRNMEIDVISVINDTLVFTEIKTRSSYHFGFPEEAVTLRKQYYLKQAAIYYCETHPGYSKMRFDVISLLADDSGVKESLHFEDAFY